ncbi:hypothetical protein LPC08_16180 [Roseomonas sp. OT10]|uniref:hypothetical protein n=1 Tax=Roseomonas cutis TaxID=2897332 RepID=UPI001E60EBDD|nr:hypothetical protein [Roseomonas sp. OT10]UFN47545.1 hypothetical protein LPC08_16180 [Roseomonas sp. OT10]
MSLEQQAGMALRDATVLLGHLGRLPSRRLRGTFSDDPAEDAATFTRLVALLGREPAMLVASPDDLAFLLAARDTLSARAAPVSASSAAFSALVLGEEEVVGIDRWDRAWAGFAAAARRARRTRFSLAIAAMAILVAAVLVSTYVVFGKTTLRRVQEIARQTVELDLAIQQYEAAEVAAHRGTPRAETPVLRLCDRVGNWYRPPFRIEGGPEAFESAGQYHLCDRLRDLSRKSDIAYADLAAWLTPVRLVSLPWTRVTGALGLMTEQPGVLLTSEQSGASLLEAIGNLLLPLLFGTLGALVYALRHMEQQMAENRLLPGATRQAWLRVMLGLLMGACIGLFLRPEDTPVQGLGGLPAQVTLTFSGIAFLVGFSVEVVFRVLETMVNAVARQLGGPERPEPARVPPSPLPPARPGTVA